MGIQADYYTTDEETNEKLVLTATITNVPPNGATVFLKRITHQDGHENFGKFIVQETHYCILEMQKNLQYVTNERVEIFVKLVE